MSPRDSMHLTLNIIIIKLSKRVDLNYSYHTKKKLLNDVIEILILTAMVIILQYINVSINMYTLNLHDVVCPIYFNKNYRLPWDNEAIHFQII